MSDSNGNSNGSTSTPSQMANEKTLRKLHELATNFLHSRMEIYKNLIDPRRDIEHDCGHPGLSEYINPEIYSQMYDREAISARVVEVYPKECFQTTPLVYEDEDSDTVTEFEKAWDSLGSQLRNMGNYSYFREEKGSIIWDYLKRADELSGVGQYGIILIGVDDGLTLDQPVNGIDTKDNQAYSPSPQYYDYSGSTSSTLSSSPFPNNPPASTVNPSSLTPTPEVGDRVKKPKRTLLFLRVFPETMAQILSYEGNINNPRFGQPILYLITLSDPKNGPMGGVNTQFATVRVHWTRIVHICDTWHHASTSEVLATPRMKPVLNHLINLKKLYGGSAEMYWRGALPGLVFETHPSLAGDVGEDEIDIEKTKDQMQRYMNSLQRYLLGIGGSWKMLSPVVVDPSPQIKSQLEAICIKLGIPMRIFLGSERGELASTQDDDAWNDRIKERQNSYLIPRVISPFIDRLIYIGILPAPGKKVEQTLDDGNTTNSSTNGTVDANTDSPPSYRIHWEDITSISEIDKTRIMVRKTQAISAYIASGGEAVMSLMDFYTRIMHFTEEEAEAIIDNLETSEKVLSTSIALDPTHPDSPSNPDNIQAEKDRQEKISQDNLEFKGQQSLSGLQQKTRTDSQTRKFGPSDPGDREHL